MPLATRGKVAKKVRQLKRKLAEPGILLKQHQNVSGFPLPGLVLSKAIRLFEQR